MLDEILDPGTYQNHRFSAPGAGLAEARRGLADGYATFCRIRIGRELGDAGGCNAVAVKKHQGRVAARRSARKVAQIQAIDLDLVGGRAGH